MRGGKGAAGRSIGGGTDIRSVVEEPFLSREPRRRPGSAYGLERPADPETGRLARMEIAGTKD